MQITLAHMPRDMVLTSIEASDIISVVSRDDFPRSGLASKNHDRTHKVQRNDFKRPASGYREQKSLHLGPEGSGAFLMELHHLHVDVLGQTKLQLLSSHAAKYGPRKIYEAICRLRMFRERHARGLICGGSIVVPVWQIFGAFWDWK